MTSSPAQAVACVGRGEAIMVSDTQPSASARHFCRLPALTFRASFALLKAGRVFVTGNGEDVSLHDLSFNASPGVPGVPGVHGAPGEGLPRLGEIKPVRGFAARAVM